MKRIVLASASPRRREMLKQLGLEFDVVIKPVAETIEDKTAPAEAVSMLAWRKAREVAGTLGEGIVIGADTVVVHRDKILGKPASPSEALAVLRTLSGSAHLVVTGLCVMDAATGKTVKDTQTTRVFFRRLADDEIRAYVESGEPMDKAGSYGIQGLGAVLVDRIDGCYFNVVGLPLTRLSLALREFGINIPG